MSDVGREKQDAGTELVSPIRLSDTFGCGTSLTDLSQLRQWKVGRSLTSRFVCMLTCRCRDDQVGGSFLSVQLTGSFRYAGQGRDGRARSGAS